MISSGMTRGMAAVAVSALAVAGLPLLAGTAHAELSEVAIVNHRDRLQFDTDELRDNDDFTIETRDESGEAANEGVAPEYRWVLTHANGGAVVTSNWLQAKPRAKGAGRFQVYGPSSHDKGADGVRNREVRDGTWVLEARVGGLQDAVTIRTSESEVTLAGGSAELRVTDQGAVSGTLRNAHGGLGGREVQVTYVPDGSSDAHLSENANNTATVVTAADGGFSVTLEGGGSGDSGTLRAVASGENEGDGTQLNHRYGPDDRINPPADAMDDLVVLWGSEPDDRSAIVAVLTGRSKGARADRLKVSAPGRAHGAEVRLLKKTKSGGPKLLAVKELNRRGDMKFVVKDRNGRRVTQYVALVRATSRTLGDRTGVKKVR